MHNNLSETLATKSHDCIRMMFAQFAFLSPAFLTNDGLQTSLTSELNISWYLAVPRRLVVHCNAGSRLLSCINNWRYQESGNCFQNIDQMADFSWIKVSTWNNIFSYSCIHPDFYVYAYYAMKQKCSLIERIN